MKSNKPVRVRFAPSPTGMMHLGNVRTALMNYLFAKKNNGTFILRVEDTDPQRNFDPEAKKIIDDLHWLGIDYQEGPEKNGLHAPYFQSQRNNKYQEKLKQLIEKNLVYRCFCTSDELEKRRQRQIALKLPPRYDRTCLKLTDKDIQEKLQQNTPFIWRFKLDHNKVLSIEDLSHGTITFDLKNFSDFPISRQDGSFTFMFANLVDDIDMEISHVLRGEDHLTNTAGQVALYNALDAPVSAFWHLPILASKNGKKLSKRDFGFALRDLKDAGYLPESIANYLAIIGGGTFKKEIMSLKELVQELDFQNIHATGQVKYDVEKLKWLNHKWIELLDPATLTKRSLPFLQKKYPQAQNIDAKKLTELIQAIKTDLITLADITKALEFYFEKPKITRKNIGEKYIPTDLIPQISDLIKEHIGLLSTPEQFMKAVKKTGQEQNISIKYLFWFLRLALMGQVNGPGIAELITMLGPNESKNRIESVLN